MMVRCLEHSRKRRGGRWQDPVRVRYQPARSQNPTSPTASRILCGDGLMQRSEDNAIIRYRKRVSECEGWAPIQVSTAIRDSVICPVIGRGVETSGHKIRARRRRLGLVDSTASWALYRLDSGVPAR